MIWPGLVIRLISFGRMLAQYEDRFGMFQLPMSLAIALDYGSLCQQPVIFNVLVPYQAMPCHFPTRF